MTYFTTSISLPVPSSRFGRINTRVNYLMPYIPATSTVEVDDNNAQHRKYKTYSSKIYSSKYRDSNSFHYLFTDDLKSNIQSFVSDNNDIKYIIPTGSSHPLVIKFAEHLTQFFTDCQIVNCIKRVEKGEFQYIPPDVTFTNGSILIIDDVITSGSSLQNTAITFMDASSQNINNIKFLCIGKTTRNMFEWENEIALT